MYSPLSLLKQRMLPIERLSVDSEEESLLVHCGSDQQSKDALYSSPELSELAEKMECVAVKIMLGSRVAYTWHVATFIAMQDYLGKS